jgi:hypothetical protein
MLLSRADEVQSFIVTTDDPTDHIVSDSSFNGVTRLEFSARNQKGGYCSGALLETSSISAFQIKSR